MTTRVKSSEKDPADIVKEVRSIYARWKAGEVSQEDALFEIGDSLAELLRAEAEPVRAKRQD